MWEFSLLKTGIMRAFHLEKGLSAWFTIAYELVILESSDAVSRYQNQFSRKVVMKYG
jgi:hypothetical protein